ncbi:amidase [Amycolatopsis saalfeldensis]|uniref:Amidase n=1 Tax=Amycolatopsis saalfeldensis TaxID=394193 RepID=A0A1H8XDB5_9PSEU|nr:amidase [Amycolatopsis saalfeldensis]SEP37925.1 amidase [Amycolatopsis saalfeldensis]
MTELHELPAAAQLAALRRREFSSRELTAHYLDRIGRLDGELGAFVTLTAESALEDADRADAELAAGQTRPLLGLPFGIKDLSATAGVRTTLGSAAMAGYVPEADCWTVRLLRESGIVLLGKTNTPELGSACYTENKVTARPSATPYAAGHYSSGSSGGAATAVAAGLLPLAHGSDGAGSIRTPAAACHLVGVKPSRGLVSMAPATTYFSAGVDGPIARTVEDAALMLDVIGHAHPGDLYGWDSGGSFTDAVAQPPGRPLRIAMWTETGVDGVEAHPEAVRAARHAAGLLRAQGHQVEEIGIPARFDAATRQAVLHMFGASIATAVRTMLPPGSRDLLTPHNTHLLSVGERLSGTDTVVFQNTLARYSSTLLAALAEFDFALTPTTNGPPVPFGHYDAQGPDHVVDRMLAWSCHTPWANFTGVPAVAMPSHLDENGMPHGFQLVGHQRQDARLLALAAALESAGPHTDVHPPCWRD